MATNSGDVERVADALGDLKDRCFLAGGAICRWKLGPIIVDLMPADGSILGFTNKWYQAGIASLIPMQVTKSCKWRMLSPPYLLATKCTAFSDRGISDPGSSSDLEDIVSLLNGRPNMAMEISGSEPECKRYLTSWFADMLRNPAVMDVIPYHLPPHDAGQARLSIVLERMKRISELPL